MNPSVIAAFENRAAADAALDRLAREGVRTRDIRVDAAPDVINAATIDVDEMATGGFFGNAARLLDDLFDRPADERRAVDYQDLVRRFAFIVTVELETGADAKSVAERLSAAGAKRVSTLPQPGLDA